MPRKPRKKTRLACWRQLFQDKAGRFAIREVAALGFLLATLAAWIGDQFLGFKANETVFVTLASTLIGLAVNYTFERTDFPRRGPGPANGDAPHSPQPPFDGR